jgi:hypothetical protein
MRQTPRARPPAPLAEARAFRWRYRDTVTPMDRYVPEGRVLKVLNMVTNAYEHCPIGPLRKAALAFILDYVHGEDQQTNYIDIGPVNKVSQRAGLPGTSPRPRALGRSSTPW